MWGGGDRGFNKLVYTEHVACVTYTMRVVHAERLAKSVIIRRETSAALPLAVLDRPNIVRFSYRRPILLR